MNKELFKEFLTSAIEEKKNLLVVNSISDDDKEMIQAQITNLEGLVDAIINVFDEIYVDEAMREEMKAFINDIRENKEKMK